MTEYVALFNLQDCANLAWAFAMQGISSRGVYAALQGRLASQAEDAKPLSVASTLWAMGRARGWGRGSTWVAVA